MERKIQGKIWNPRGHHSYKERNTEAETEQWVTTVTANSYIMLTMYQTQF